MPTQKIELSGEIASCSTARRFVQERLADAPDEVRDDASLLISEVVTNSILHTNGPVTVEVQERDGGYRIAVSDRSKRPPTEKGYRTDDATGRGLQLLSSLAAAWGWERLDAGKVVWFDLSVPLEGVPSPRSEPRQHTKPRPPRADPYPNGQPIALLNAPIQEMIRTGAHYDALYREFRLILELDPSGRQAIPGRLLALIDLLGTSFLGYGSTAEDSWETAVAEQRVAVDVHFRLPPEFGPGVEYYDQLLDEADEYCERAELLTVAPTEEAVAVRRWAFGEVARQCRGEAPTPWSPLPQ